MPVRQMRLAVTAEDYTEALAFYRDVMGLPEIGTFHAEGGSVTILDAGRATLELADSTYAAHIDRVEVGQRVAGHVRVEQFILGAVRIVRLGPPHSERIEVA